MKEKKKKPTLVRSMRSQVSGSGARRGNLFSTYPQLDLDLNTESRPILISVTIARKAVRSNLSKQRE